MEKIDVRPCRSARVSADENVDGRSRVSGVKADGGAPGPAPWPDGGDQIAGTAAYDSVTGLASPRLLIDRGRAIIEGAERNSSSTAVIVVDIDRFRDVNGQFGHAVGDEVLVRVGDRLASAFRYDVVARSDITMARFGADEFVVVCEEVPDTDTVWRLAERIQETFRAPVTVSTGDLPVTAAVGCSVAASGELDFDTLLLQAEATMRIAKQAGPGRVEVFDHAHTAGQTRVHQDRELRGALETHQLYLDYQPKVALDTNRVTGVEALLRWAHPERGTVPPSEFISLAEDSALIVPIGRWVLQEACRRAADWYREFPDRPPLAVCVNVSTRQVGPGLVEDVAGALEASRIPPGSLVLEVTESVLVENMEDAMVIFHALADLGVRLAIDDFGTGYSSLAYLKHLPVSELKIDKSFIDGLGQDPGDTAIVAAAIAMAHALGSEVVAEGVETADQVERLRTLGCDVAQGFHFCRPVSVDRIDALLAGEAADTWRDHGEPGDAPTGYRAERVLVVDDAPEVRQLARMSLSAVGFEVVEVVDGPSAIAAARAAPPDCVLLDLVMPGMSGIDVCRQLRAEPATANCTILILTANSDTDDKLGAFSSGADDYILKPFTPRDLTSRVRSAMRRRRDSTVPGGSTP